MKVELSRRPPCHKRGGKGPFHCIVQHGKATMLPVRLVRFGIEGSQRRQSLLDLAAQGQAYALSAP